MMPPGEARVSADPSSPLAAVRELLAKAEAEHTTPRDAEALTARAVSLLAYYGLDRVRLTEVDPEADLLADRIIDLDNPWAAIKAHLLAHTAEALRCEAIETSRPAPGTRLHLFGYASDIERTELIAASLLTQMSQALAAQEVPATATSVRAWRRSWMLGYATAAVACIEAAEARALAEADDGPELAIVLHQRAQAVRSRSDEAYPFTRTTRESYTASSGYDTGYSHG
jgi:Lon protease-like protein